MQLPVVAVERWPGRTGGGGLYSVQSLVETQTPPPVLVAVAQVAFGCWGVAGLGSHGDRLIRCCQTDDMDLTAREVVLLWPGGRVVRLISAVAGPVTSLFLSQIQLGGAPISYFQGLK